MSKEYVDQIIELATRNPNWGYRRIAGVMKFLKMKVSPSTIKRVLDDFGLVPTPEQKKRVRWEEFIYSNLESLAATDFFTVEVLTSKGLKRYHVLFFMHLKSRKVEIAGMKHRPNGEWVEQIGRNQTDIFSGFLVGKKYLIHDRDSLFTKRFSSILKSTDIQPMRLTKFMPMMNGFAESFVKTIKSECINQIIFTSEKQLRYVLKEYLEYYNHERPHRGLGGDMIEPRKQDPEGKVVEFTRLGGLLKSYRRVSVLKKVA